MIGYIAGLTFTVLESKRLGLDAYKVAELSFWCLLSGFVGTKILWFFMNFGAFTSGRINLVDFIFFGGGAAFNGAIAGVVITTFIWAKLNKQNFLKLIDILSQASVLGLSIGRWGCFSAGCCIGRETNILWGITPKLKTISTAELPLHPTQVYESMGCIFIFIFLRTIVKDRKFFAEDVFFLFIYLLLRIYLFGYSLGYGFSPFIDFYSIVIISIFYYILKHTMFLISSKIKKRFDGQIFIFFTISYSLMRFMLEYLRHPDKITGWLLKPYFSTTHLTSLIFIIFSLLLWMRLKNKKTEWE